MFMHQSFRICIRGGYGMCSTNLFFKLLDRDKYTVVLWSADGPPCPSFQHPSAPTVTMHGQQIPLKIPLNHLLPPINHRTAPVESSCPPVRDAGMDKDSEATVLLSSDDDMSWDLPEKSQSSHNLAMVTDEDIGSCQLVEHTDGV
jgi:hypothetical protein